MTERGVLLTRMTRALADASSEPRALLTTFAAQVTVALDAHCGYLRVVGDQLEPVAHAAPAGSDACLATTTALSLDGDSNTARAVREARTIHVPELTDRHLGARFPDAAMLETARRAAPRSGLFVPVRIRDQAIGAIALIRAGEQRSRFTPEDMDFAAQLADLAAIALANSVLVDEARDRAARLELLSQLTRDFARAAGSYQDLLDVIASRVGETLGDACAIRMVSEEASGAVSHVSVYNRDPALASAHAALLRELGPRAHGGLAARVLETRTTAWVPRVDLAELLAGTMPEMRGLVARLAPTSVLAVPICMHDAPLAAIILVRSTGKPAFTAADQQLVEDLAAHAAVAITNTRLIEKAARTTERLRLLTEASAAFAAGVDDPHGILHTVARQLNTLIGGLCVIDLNQDGEQPSPRPREDHVIELPLRAGSQVIGSLTLSRGAGGHYTDDDRRFAQELVTHAALAIRNSRLLAHVQRELAERVRTEQALRESEDRFYQAQKMDAIGRLAGGVAHDFNNLLSVVLTSCDFMSEADPPPALREDIDQIRRAGQRAAELTRQLLAFSRQQPIEPRVLDLNVQVGEIRVLLRRLLGEEIALEIALAPTLGTVLADETHVEQILMNLAINARDAMSRGGTLTVSTACVELDEADAAELREVPPGPYVMISVTDTGHGMTEETRARIFEPFFTTKARGKGTGLGLATVFGIVSQNGGAIRVRSEPGHGTTFEVLFPRTDQIALPRTASVDVVGSGRGETVLVVEDEDAVRRMVVAILTRSGYRVVETRNGQDALAMFERHRGAFDLVLSDVVMPVMGGGELVQRLRKLQPALKVLYMSGYPDASSLQHHPLEPGVPLLAKPLLPATVLRKVREVLDARAAS